MERHTELKRGGWLRRRKPMNRVNRERKARRSAENFGDRAPIVREMACLCHGKGGEAGNPCAPPMQAAHARSRGARGTRRDLVPLCAQHHFEQHHRGIETFERLYGVDLGAEAERIAAELDEMGVA